MSFEHLDRPLTFVDLGLARRPDICFAVFGSTNYIFGIFTEGGMNLTAGVLVPFQFDVQTFVP